MPLNLARTGSVLRGKRCGLWTLERRNHMNV
jgi:hypothetical protein